LFKEKKKKAVEYLQKLKKIKSQNLVEIYKYWHIPEEVIFVEMEAPII
jgi:hypothetical protein